jgi:lipopolysaccharide export system permease protein
MFKIYQKYLLINFIKKLLIVSSIFLLLVIILSLLEEITFLGSINTNPFLPYFLTLLNAPITLYEIFPFIFLLSTQYLFYELFKNDELNFLKKNGLSNIKLIKILFFLSILIGIFNIIFYYNFASKLKLIYSGIKNSLSSDNKYLAVVNDNGLWIKDIVENDILIIKSNYIDGNYLYDVIISKFSRDFKLLSITQSKKIDINNKEWIISNPIITENNQTFKYNQSINLKTNFDLQKINNLFSNINTLNLMQLINLKKDYEKLGYNTNEITSHLLKIFTTPILYSLLTVLSAIIMFNLKKKDSIINHIILGVIISVIIYYILYFFSILGKNETIPIVLSIFFPLIIISIISFIGLTRINEK